MSDTTWPGDEMDSGAPAGIEFEALGEAGAAEGILERQLRQVQLHGVLQSDVVSLRHQHVMEEPKTAARQVCARAVQQLHVLAVLQERQRSLCEALGECCANEPLGAILLPVTVQ